MSIRGKGDQWLAGEWIDGVRLSHHAEVEIVSGPHAGKRGLVAFLMSLDADPLFLVQLSGGGGDVRVRQSALRALD